MATTKGLRPIVERISLPVEVAAVSAAGVRTSYLMAGTGPSVILLHGAMAAGVA